MSEWIKWDGGKCPIGDMRTLIEGRLRNGDTFRLYPHEYDWNHTDSIFDLVEYRIVGEKRRLGLTPKFHVVFDEALTNGIERGLRLFHKHRDDNLPDDLAEKIRVTIMGELHEWFDFPQENDDD